MFGLFIADTLMLVFVYLKVRMVWLRVVNLHVRRYSVLRVAISPRPAWVRASLAPVEIRLTHYLNLPKEVCFE
jgi:hypothetical protein